MSSERSLEELIAAGEVESALLFDGGMTDRDKRIAEWFIERNAKLEAQLQELREAVESDAATAAYKAGLGATEWEAFVGKRAWSLLAPKRTA